MASLIFIYWEELGLQFLCSVGEIICTVQWIVIFKCAKAVKIIYSVAIGKDNKHMAEKSVPPSL